MLTNPKKTRIIAEAKIKNDKLDARLLADLVRTDLVARSYVPPKETRMQRALLRERISLVQSRTMIKNCVFRHRPFLASFTSANKLAQAMSCSDLILFLRGS